MRPQIPEYGAFSKMPKEDRMMVLVGLGLLVEEADKLDWPGAYRWSGALSDFYSHVKGQDEDPEVRQQAGVCYAEFSRLVNRPSFPIEYDIGLAGPLSRGKLPTMKKLGILAERGYSVSTDEITGLREFYLPKGAWINREGRVVNPMPFFDPELLFRYLYSPRDRPTQLTHSISVIEVPTPRYFWVTLSGGDGYYQGHFNSNEQPLNRVAADIVKALRL